MGDASEFDIYQTTSGYVAVTNEVRRKILAALAKRERELPDLVKITGKAKPTLSNLHMKELLSQGVIGERQHPTDARRKVYHLVGHRIGSSSVPLDQLRGAVKQYVSRAPLAHSLPPADVLSILVAGAPMPAEGLRAQARALGKATAPVVAASSERELLTAVAAYWERETFARTGMIDLDGLLMEVDADARYGEDEETLEAIGVVLGGFLEGAAEGRLGPRAPLAEAELVRGRRIRLHLVPR